MKIKFQNKNKGFSLLETVVYISILGVLSVSVVNVILTTAKAAPRLKTTQSLNYSSTLVMSRLSREIRTAYDIDLINSTLGVHPGRLTLKTTKPDNTLTTVEFYLENGSLKMKEAGISQGSLISGNVQIRNLVFKQITTANSKAIKVEMEIESKIGQLPQSKQKSAKFYDTLILRGGY